MTGDLGAVTVFCCKHSETILQQLLQAVDLEQRTYNGLQWCLSRPTVS